MKIAICNDPKRVKRVDIKYPVERETNAIDVFIGIGNPALPLSIAYQSLALLAVIISDINYLRALLLESIAVFCIRKHQRLLLK